MLGSFGIVNNISNIKIKPNPEIQLTKGVDFYEHSGFSWLAYEVNTTREAAKRARRRRGIWMNNFALFELAQSQWGQFQ